MIALLSVDILQSAQMKLIKAKRQLMFYKGQEPKETFIVMRHQAVIELYKSHIFLNSSIPEGRFIDFSLIYYNFIYNNVFVL